MFVMSVDQLMSHFSSNLPRPPRSRVLRSPGAACGEQPLVFSSSPVTVPTPAATVNPLPNLTGSLVLAVSQGHSINEDPVTSVEPFEFTPRGGQGKTTHR